MFASPPLDHRSGLPERADALGLVSRLVEPGEATTEGLKLAEQITKSAPLAAWESRQVVLASASEDDERRARVAIESPVRVVLVQSVSVVHVALPGSCASIPKHKRPLSSMRTTGQASW